MNCCFRKLDYQWYTTTVDTSNVVIEDPLIKLSKNNDSDSVDIGIYGLYGEQPNILVFLEIK